MLRVQQQTQKHNRMIFIFDVDLSRTAQIKSNQIKKNSWAF